MAGTARYSGFRAALDSAGIDLRPEYVQRGEFHHQDGLAAGPRAAGLKSPPTAIFASSDVQALGVYEAARGRGVAIPSDLSIVGFDDLKVARWAGPALTTVRVPIAEMAEQAVHLVLSSTAARRDAVPRIDMATSLVVRDSTAAAEDESFSLSTET